MRKIVLLSALVSAMLVAMLPGSPAEAVPRTWISGTGSGVACTRAAPCASFAAAYNATDAGGEINCVDSGEFAANPTITKSITIDCGGTFGAFSFISLTVSGAGIVVRLRNLSLQGTGASNQGIVFQYGAALYVENCTISGYQGGGIGQGIHVGLINGVTANVYVTDSIISNNGVAAGGGGIVIQAPGTGSARVTIERSRIEGNTYGIVGIGSGGATLVHVRDSVVANNVVDGIGAYTSGGQSTVSITLDHSSSLLNGGNGVTASGPASFVVLGNSTVMSNGTGLSSSTGGAILSYQNNQLAGNATDGAPTGMLSVK